MSRHVLIISPIPSHPQVQGNSARIFRFNRMWQQAGFKVHFLYFGLEGLTPENERAMREAWDFFYYLQPSGPAPEPSLTHYYDIDDWYDERVSELVTQLCDEWDFHSCVVNYVWFSRALEAVTAGTRKLIDTHDVFGDRHIVAREAGMEPVWFYTTRELEARGLARADTVIAIQDTERRYFESIYRGRVAVFGHLLPPRYLPPRPRSGPMRVGYIGSGNPFNENSIRELQRVVLEHPTVRERFSFELAGPVCETLGTDNRIFNMHGMVDSVTGFYREQDLIINPMVGGTGLKIKSLEALAFGLPLLATRDAMEGIESSDSMQQCDTVEQLVELLAGADAPRLDRLRDNSIAAHRAYNARFIREFKDLYDW